MKLSCTCSVIAHWIFSIAFLRAQKNAYSKCQLAFFFGKARVAPIKKLSILKLELQGALLASRLKDDVEYFQNIHAD